MMSEQSQKLMTQTEYAGHRGVSQTSISKYVRKGKIPKSCIIPVEIDGRTYKKIDAEKADEALADNLNKMKSRQPKEPVKNESPAESPSPADAIDMLPGGIQNDASLAEAERMEKIYKARLKEIELAEKSEELCPRKEFETALKTMGRSMRDMIAGVGSRLKQQLSEETAPDKCERLVDDELYDCMVASIPKEHHKILEIET